MIIRNSLSVATGQAFYLQLCPTSEAWERLFENLEKLTYHWDHEWRVMGVLRPPHLCIE